MPKLLQFLFFLVISHFHNAVHRSMLHIYREYRLKSHIVMTSVNSKISHKVSHHAWNEPLNGGHRNSIPFLM